MAFVKISLIACLLAAVNAQYTALPGYTVAHAPVAVSAVPAYHVPVAPIAHVAHVAAPVVASHPSPLIRILSQTQENAPDGSYSFGYESEDGSSRQESGTPQSASAPGVENFGGVAVQGRFAYASPEGPVDISYVADEAGYQPSGPGVHPAIVKAVAEQVAKAKAEGPIPPSPAAKVLPVYHAPVVHAVAPVYHAPVVHAVAPVYHAPIVHAPAVYHAPLAVSPAYVSPTPAAFLRTTLAKK